MQCPNHDFSFSNHLEKESSLKNDKCTLLPEVLFTQRTILHTQWHRVACQGHLRTTAMSPFTYDSLSTHLNAGG